MLCVALVHLQDWPLNEARDVDETREDILGKLRAYYIAPLTRPNPAPPVTPPANEPPAQAAPVEAGPESPQTAQRARQRKRA